MNPIRYEYDKIGKYITYEHWTNHIWSIEFDHFTVNRWMTYDIMNSIYMGLIEDKYE